MQAMSALTWERREGPVKRMLFQRGTGSKFRALRNHAHNFLKDGGGVICKKVRSQRTTWGPDGGT